MRGLSLTLNQNYQKILALLATATALSMVLLDSTMFPLVLPTISFDMNLSNHQIQWLMNGYFLTTAALVIVIGKLADVFGYRRTFSISLFVYALANLLFAQSDTYLSMLVCRIIQGAAAAALGPIGLAILFDTFPHRERGRAIGISAGISSVFLSLGPLIGGVLVEFASWRTIFLVYLPFAVIGVILSQMAVQESARRKEKVDLLSLFLSIGFICAIIVPLMQAKVWGVTSYLFGGSLSIGVIFLILLVLRNSKSHIAFIDFSLFKDRHFLFGSIVAFLSWMIMVNPIFWSLFLQKGLFYSPVETASYIVLSTLPVLLTAPASGLIADRKGYQQPIYLGFCFVLLFVFLLMCFCIFHSIFYLVIAFVNFGIGTSLVITPVGNATLSKIHPSKRGLASGIYTTMRFLGSSIGIVVLGYVSYRSRHHAFANLASSSPLIESFSFKDASDILHHSSATLSPETYSSLRSTFINSCYAGFSAITVFTGFIAIIALLLTLVYLKDYREGN